MRVTVNGTSTELPAGTTVADLVHRQGARSRGAAVARNGEVVARSDWASAQLADGDVVELLVAVQGG